MIGKTILHYKILEKLGEGGMGVVYKAIDLKLDRHVALKFLPAHLLQSTDDVARFQQEAKALSTLNHPNIATIHDIEQPEGQKFLDLEYLPGGTLKTRLLELQKTGTSFSIEQIINYGVEILEGLRHAHKKGIIHRDLKTDNMMLTDDGRVKITDFGLAKFRDRPTPDKTSMAVGTIAYMSPEQLRGEEIDSRSDLFSFGIVVFELSTGQLPFRGAHEAALSYSIANEDPALPRTFRADFPEGLQRIILRCLEKDASKRFQTADEILRELKSFRSQLEGFTAPAKLTIRQAVVAVTVIVVAAVVGTSLFNRTPLEQKSIGVLPFRNLSDDKEDIYFSNGITDDIITELSKISNLKVMSFASQISEGGDGTKTQDIVKKSNVSALLQGSVRKAGARVRITAQLLDPSSSGTLWAETYERELKDVFKVQSEVALQIASELQSKLSLDEQKTVGAAATENIEAYNLYLQGRYFWNKRTDEGLTKAVAYFEQAIDTDSSFARGYAGLAESYVVLASNAFASPKEVMPKAKEAALKALSLNNLLAEAHAALGMVAFWYEWDTIAAEREFKLALEINPNYATAHQWYAWYLAALNRSEEAISEITRARDLEPLSLVISTEVGAIHYFAGRYEEEFEHYKRTLDMDQSFSLAHLHLGFAHLADGDFDEAIRELEAAVRLSDGNPTMVAALGDAYAEAGKKELAQRLLDALKKLAIVRYVSPAHIAGLSTALGNKDEAFAFLEKAFQERSTSLVWIKMGRGFNGLRKDRRFEELLKKITIDR